jgi:hypothetical protein
MNPLVHKKSFYYNAIVYVKNEQGEEKFLKYHNIMNADRKKAAFYSFLKTQFPDVQYVNFYELPKGKAKGVFVERIYLV